MNELALYQLFRNILTASTVIEGRLFLSTLQAYEVNVSNMANMVTDALDGAVIQKKYPCVLMLPPHETGDSGDNRYSTMRFDLFFLTLAGRTGDGDVKSPDYETNRSLHTREQDWKDMRECAGNFRAKLLEILRVPPLSQYVGQQRGATETYNRITSKGNDNLNGVHLIFEVLLRSDLCEPAEYPAETEIVIPDDLIPHESHKH